MFKFEFCHEPEYFPDFEVRENESHFERFKRAFKLYNELRILVKGMVHETIRNKKKHSTEENLDSLVEYISPYTPHGRECNPIIAGANYVTLEFICFYKNWTDIAHFRNLN